MWRQIYAGLMQMASAIKKRHLTTPVDSYPFGQTYERPVGFGEHAPVGATGATVATNGSSAPSDHPTDSLLSG